MKEKCGTEITTKIKNKVINKNILSFDMEINLDGDIKVLKYSFHIEGDFEEDVEQKIIDDKPTKEEIVDETIEENPETGDNIFIYVAVAIISIVGIICAIIISKKKKIEL